MITVALIVTTLLSVTTQITGSITEFVEPTVLRTQTVKVVVVTLCNIALRITETITKILTETMVATLLRRIYTTAEIKVTERKVAELVTLGVKKHLVGATRTALLTSTGVVEAELGVALRLTLRIEKVLLEALAGTVSTVS